MTSQPLDTNADAAASRRRPNALVVRGLPGQPSPSELERQAAAGERPRSIHVEVARALDADIIDANFLAERGALASRAVARSVGLLEGQVLETFIRRGRYRHIVAFADRLGLELALLLKIARSKRSLALVSSRLTSRAKRPYLAQLRVQTHLRPIISYSSAQLEIAAERYDLPKERLHVVLQPVDELYWHPTETETETKTESEDLICSVGCVTGFRDYATLVQAVRDLPVRVELAVGSFILSPAARRHRAEQFQKAIPPDELPENVRYQMEMPYSALRDLYARSRFVVMPLEEVDFDAGVTSITEAMAMGKAVIVTRNRGQVDVIRDGVEGIYVPAHDPRALREAIVHLLENPAEAERMGRAGRAAVLERHRLDHYAAQIAELVLKE